MVVTPCGPSGLNVARAVVVEQGYEREPAPIHRQQEMARAVLIWENPRKRKNAMKTRALIVSNHTVKIVGTVGVYKGALNLKPVQSKNLRNVLFDVFV